MGGFTKIPKLSVGDLGSEGTGDRIVLFDEAGNLVGYKMNAEGEGEVIEDYNYSQLVIDTTDF